MNKYGFVVTDKNIAYIAGIEAALKIDTIIRLEELAEKGSKKIRDPI